MKETKGIQKKRDERKKHALSVVLEGRGATQHFWDALLISNIDNVIDSIEWLQSEIGSVGMTIDGASKSANRLAAKIKTLTWVMTIASIVGLAIGTYATFFK